MHTKCPVKIMVESGLSFRSLTPLIPFQLGLQLNKASHSPQCHFQQRAGQGAKALANFWQALDKECDHKTTMQNFDNQMCKLCYSSWNITQVCFGTTVTTSQLDQGSEAVQPRVLLFLFKSVNHQKSSPLQPGAVFRFHIISTSLAAEQGKSAYENCSGKISEVNILVGQPR